jgi:hypothetical protein
MASPHVAGLAALVVSQIGRGQPGNVAAVIGQTADPTDCPTAAQVSLYAPFPSTSNGVPQKCQGSVSSNSWFGKGIVNALSAVSK